MKKFFLSALMLGAFYTAQAQTNLTGTAAASRTVLSMSATELSRQMYNDLELNEGQYVKIKSLNQARLDRFNEIERMNSNDIQMRDAKLAEVNTQMDEEFAQILTPKQFTAYLELDGRGTSTAAPASNNTTTMPTSSMDTTATAPKKSESEVKMKDDKIKLETETEKVKIEEDKMKMESSYGEMKIKKDGTEKLKTDNVKYKSSPSETKIKTPNGKTKVEADKVKTKTETSKKKTKN
ncbi:hypothetical protein [Rufibacter sp. LB8]|uniref:hypothetical protein n=1 Tax=Rufibacter sp. LB8 TaxID=2777781 RepID=UPI00178C2F97|nr:hypothetical protein [Rufibacter sp. LB8]